MNPENLSRAEEIYYMGYRHHRPHVALNTKRSRRHNAVASDIM